MTLPPPGSVKTKLSDSRQRGFIPDIKIKDRVSAQKGRQFPQSTLSVSSCVHTKLS